MSGTHLSRGGAVLADAVRALYREGQSDYSLEPLVLVDAHGKPVGCIQDGDAVVFCCRRGEREIQLTEAFVDPNLNRFPRREFQDLTFVTLTLYHEKFKDLPVAFAPTRIEDTWARSSAVRACANCASPNLKNTRTSLFSLMAATASVPGEDDVRVPSPQGFPSIGCRN